LLLCLADRRKKLVLLCCVGESHRWI
jgi:hypothetical protein